MAVQTLAAFPDAHEVTPGKVTPEISLTLTLRDQIPEVVAKLVTAGVPLYQITPKEPTLEDIYFALHESNEEVSR
jgi:ABC-2 type transport system ATP-binding protein